jgi:hypothetical protein
VLSKDGITSEKMREEEISVYEKKLSAKTSDEFHRFTYRENYKEHVFDLLKALTDGGGKPLFKRDSKGKEEELEKLRRE